MYYLFYVIGDCMKWEILKLCVSKSSWSRRSWLQSSFHWHQIWQTRDTRRRHVSHHFSTTKFKRDSQRESSKCSTGKEDHSITVSGSEISTHHHVSIIIMCIRQKANIRVCSPSKNEWPVRPVRDSKSMTDNCRISTEFFCTRKFGVFQQTEEGTLSCASRSEI